MTEYCSPPIHFHLATYYFKNVSIEKAGKAILTDFSWEIESGQNWAIVGPTGSGKTTLLDALSGKCLVKGEKSLPNPSTIALVSNSFSGHHLLNRALQYYQQRFNSQDAELAPKVIDFLTDKIKPVGTVDEKSVHINPFNIEPNELKRIADLFKIEHLLERHITSLSNGETRRTLLAKAVIKKPEILLLDNPFVGLDVASRASLHQVLNDLMALGVMVIMVTTPNEIPSQITNMLEVGHVNSSSEKEEKQNRIQSSVHLQQFKNEPFDDFQQMVVMRNVNVQYGAIKVLDNLNWQVLKGEKWAVLGPNGSGKSTLLSLITADNPQGYANDYDLFDKKRGSGESIWDIKQKIGYLSPELHNYFPRNYTCFQVVASGLFDRLGIKFTVDASHHQKTEFALQLLDLEHLSAQNFGQISAGEQRLVLLARALVKNPPLLILDEPCQGLDTEHIMRFRDTIDLICSDTNRTLLYVTHYADEIPRCVTKQLKLGN